MGKERGGYEMGQVPVVFATAVIWEEDVGAETEEEAEVETGLERDSEA